MDGLRVMVRSKGENRPLLLYYRDPETGKEVSKSAGTFDRREADRAAALWENDLLDRRGRDGASWDWFIERFTNEHLASLSRRGRNSYVTALNQFRSIVSITSMRQIDASIISTFKAGLLARKHPNSTIATYMGHLRAALNWAAGIGLIRECPTIKVPKIGKRKLMRGRPLTFDEYQAMRKLAKPALQRMLDVLWLSGLRLGEARRLSWDSPPLQVQVDAKPYPQILFYAEGHKAGQDDTTPITPDFAAWLQKTPKCDRKGRVVPLGGSLEKVSQRITDLGRAADVVVNDKGKFGSAHDFRRSFGTRWAANVRPVTLQKLMRHKSIETTLMYYVGLTSADAGAELWGCLPADSKDSQAQ